MRECAVREQISSRNVADARFENWDSDAELLAHYDRILTHVWPFLENLIPNSPYKKDISLNKDRIFLTAILWLVDTNGQWGDLPASFGEEYAVYQRLSRWSRHGYIEKIFNGLNNISEFPYVFDGRNITGRGRNQKGLKLPKRIHRRQKTKR